MPVVILAEKPDQGKKFATALAGKTPINKGGKYEFRSEIFGDTIVTWGIGHLVGLSLPDKYEWLPSKEKWDLMNVPFLPKEQELKYEVSKGKSQQFSVVKKCLENADMIIIATDPDREGENIAYNIFKLCKKSIFDKRIKRLWINSLVKSEIVKGFQNLREADETISFFKEANARQIADYLVGMNYTELFTLKLQEKGLAGIISLGRVQTPVNTLVVENDQAIKNFKSEKYKLIECETQDKKPKTIFRNSHEYFNMDELEIDTKKFGLDSASTGIIKSIEVAQKQTEPQKLFSLGGIQEYANTKWKYSSKKTNKVIQDLYDQGYLSYPRTDSELITTNEFEYLKNNLNRYKELLKLEISTPCLQPNKRFVNNDKVLEHYALIPTMEIPDLTKFKAEEKNIYEIIVKRACLMFAEPYKYENTKVVLDVNGYEFQASGNVPISLGWKQVDQNIEDQKEDNEDTMLPKFTEGEKLRIKVNFVEKVTKEPKRLTEGKLVGKTGLMAKLGLGTPATRSSIIDTLISREYIKIENTKVFPTPKGYLLWDLTKNKDLLIGKPENTAQWEKALNKIAKKQYTREEFLNNIYKYLDVTIYELKNSDFESIYLEKSKTQNIHEINGYTVEEKAKVFEISKSETGEKFVIFKNISNKIISMKIVEELLKNGRTKKAITGFKSKNNKKFSAVLVFDDSEYKVKMEFDNTPSSSSGAEKEFEIGEYSVKEKARVFEITEISSQEKFIVYKENSGKIITNAIIRDLLENGKTNKKITGFKSKTGKTYSAFLVFDKVSKRISKEF
ncbi:type IA DNA topoisomerase [Candidatus Enterococcus courvalinii]|uniref:DNA topoisomerase n=1 Tax=Candidatus Enterococcus courvalinii TaxID=2815329 RepID=A0ABS3HYJ0_9ENTE|nr:type IA DNA topoisomerase [Enterococcus sp. MSG2901]MBO0481522.1 topoisomerase C-terminal repeat-containing protein [Enterococcus sp. MSG2901]